MTPKNSASRHFRIQKISQGIWSTGMVDGGWHFCNSGIIDLGEKTLVMDTGLCPQSARDLKDAAIRLTGKTPRYVINSHWHIDHVRGNQVFQEASILSSSETRKMLITKGKENAELVYAGAKSQIAVMKRLLANGTKSERMSARIGISFYEGILEGHPVLQITPPDVTFDGNLALYGQNRTVELKQFKNAHSESDIALFLPDEKILFCGDLCYIGWHPCIDMGDAVNLINVLDELIRLGPKIVVPAHGPPGSVKDLEMMKEYIQTLMGLVKKVVNGGGSSEDAAAMPVPHQYQNLKVKEFFYQRSLRYLYEILQPSLDLHRLHKQWRKGSK
jgi:glyoxylase-like metal-dependent hydrolase (beta-lactamase superfamily II)